MRVRDIVFALTLAAGSGEASAADPPTAAPEPAPPTLAFQQGPGTFPISDNLAEIDLGDGYVFLDAEGTRQLMELTQNPVGGAEVATVMPASEDAAWFLVFEWNDIGYVEDQDSDLDADALLQSLQEGAAVANEEREKRGWPSFEIVGWHDEPHYDAETNNLTWAIVGRSQGGETINRFTKLLGRHGVMTVTLVASPDQLLAADAEARQLLSAYRFQPGSTYAEFVPGKDRIAEIGLAALVLGGAGAALVKSGLLARFWKLIVVGLVAVGGAVKRFFGGRRAEDEPITKV